LLSQNVSSVQHIIPRLPMTSATHSCAKAAAATAWRHQSYCLPARAFVCRPEKSRCPDLASCTGHNPQKPAAAVAAATAATAAAVAATAANAAALLSGPLSLNTPPHKHLSVECPELPACEAVIEGVHVSSDEAAAPVHPTPHGTQVTLRKGREVLQPVGRLPA
jgi:hypothetical protein